MNVLISGGAKNGKSYYAQRIAKQMAEEQGVPLYYIATMIPRDEEDRARIRRHIAERAGWGFQTLEQGLDLPGLLCRGGGKAGSDQAAGSESGPVEDSGRTLVDPKGVFLLDSVTALLSNEMFGEDGTYDPGAARRVAADCTAFAKATGNTVFVSDYIYGDAQRYDTMTEDYRRALAAVDRQLAKVCERVVEVSGHRTGLDGSHRAGCSADPGRSDSDGGLFCHDRIHPPGRIHGRMRRSDAPAP